MNEKKQSLPCEVVNDLLPSYIDGLTSAETSRLIDEHLKSCPECKAAYDAMMEPDIEIPSQQPDKEDAEGVRYLKTIKRRQRITIISVVAGLLAVFLLAYYFLAEHIFPFPVEDVQVVERYQLANGDIYIKTYIKGDVSAVAGFAFSTAFVSDNTAPTPDAPDSHQVFEYQLGYRLISRIIQEDKPSGAYYHFLIGADELEQADAVAVYLRGWNSDERLLLWEKGDALSTPTAEQEDYIEKAILPNMGVGFFRTYE